MHGSKEPDQRFQVMMVVWGALLGGMLLFAVVLWLLASGVLTGRPWPAALDPGVGFAFLGVAMVLLAGLATWIPVMAGLAGFAMVLTRPRRDVVDRIGGD